MTMSTSDMQHAAWVEPWPLRFITSALQVGCITVFLIIVLQLFSDPPADDLRYIPVPRVAEAQVTEWAFLRQKQVSADGSPSRAEIPVSSLDVRVVGIVTYSDSGVAFIQRRGKVSAYFVGDPIDADATVLEISEYNVLVSHRGAVSMLPLRTAPEPEAALPQNVKLTQLNTILPPQLAQFSVAAAGDGQAGVAITHLRADLRAQLSLENDDVLMTIQGHSVLDVLQAPENFAELMGMEQVEVSLMREEQMLRRQYRPQLLVEIWQSIYETP